MDRRRNKFRSVALAYQAEEVRVRMGTRCQYGRKFAEESLKIKIMNPGPWEFFICFAHESLPNHENKSLFSIRSA